MEGISSIFIALLILSIITEKAILLVRSYPRTFVKIFIGVLSILIIALWLPYDSKDFLIVLYIGFYGFIFYNYNELNHYYERLTNGNKINVHYINFVLAIIFHTILLLFNFSKEELTFSAWNLFLFGLLTLFIQSLIHRDLFRHITKGKNSDDSNSKELEITFLSFLIGFLVAFLFSVDIFTILGKAIQSPNGLEAFFEFNQNFPIEIDYSTTNLFNGFIKIDQSFNLFTSTNFGILIAGFFLSFGSKFFHDILDYVLELKNLKRKLNKQETYKINQIADLDEYIQTSERIMAQKVSEEFTDALKLKHPNIISLQPSLTMIDGKKRNSIIIHLNDNNTEEIPKKMPYRLSSGRIIDIPVEVIDSLEDAEIHRRPGVRIANIKHSRKQGTYGCLVRHQSGEDYILTCSHVALSGSSEDLKGEVNDDKIYRAFGAGRPFNIANELFYARRDDNNDTALLKPIRRNNINKVKGIKIRQERSIDNERDQLEEVSFFGGKSGFQTGEIHQPCHPDEVTFKYEDGKKVTFKNLILFGRRNGSKWKSISQKGDSGSVVFDKENRAIGLLIGGNKQFSYALPIKPILEKAKCTINT